jgi:hypothetical protein
LSPQEAAGRLRPLVATVDDAGMVILRSVAGGRDFGNEIEIVGGLPDGSQAVSNPLAFLRGGPRVKPQPMDAVASNS